MAPHLPSSFINTIALVVLVLLLYHCDHAKADSSSDNQVDFEVKMHPNLLRDIMLDAGEVHNDSQPSMFQVSRAVYRAEGHIKGLTVSVMAGDSLVSVNGLNVIGPSEVKELFTHAAATEGFHAVLPVVIGDRVSFLRVEKILPAMMTFRPNGDRKQALLEDVKAKEEADKEAERLRLEALAKKAQEDLKQRNEEEERRRVEADALEEEKRKAAEELKLMVQTDEKNAIKRKNGEEFMYRARFEKPGALGVSFDMTRSNSMVVLTIERGSAASQKRIEVGDELIEVNGKNVTGLPVVDIIKTISQAPLPRVLSFHVPPKVVAIEQESVGASLVITSPDILRGSYDARLAGWSRQGYSGPTLYSLVKPQHHSGCTITPKPEGEGHDNGFMVVALRGDCTFVDKARRVQEGGGRGLVVINNVPEAADMPSGYLNTSDLRVPAVMVGSQAGDLISSVLDYHTHVRAAVVLHSNKTVIDELLQPPSCPNKDPKAKPPIDRQESERGGKFTVFSSGVERHFDFLSALFGPQETNLAGRLMLPDPIHGCDVAAFKTRVKGAIVAVDRGGGCAFTDKALAVQAAGGVACIIMNTSPGGVMRLMAAPDEAPKVKIPVYMVSDKARDTLHDMARRGNDMLARMAVETQVANKPYDDLEP